MDRSRQVKGSWWERRDAHSPDLCSAVMGADDLLRACLSCIIVECREAPSGQGSGGWPDGVVRGLVVEREQ